MGYLQFKMRLVRKDDGLQVHNELEGSDFEASVSEICLTFASYLAQILKDQAINKLEEPDPTRPPDVRQGHLLGSYLLQSIEATLDAFADATDDDSQILEDMTFVMQHTWEKQLANKLAEMAMRQGASSDEVN